MACSQRPGTLVFQTVYANTPVLEAEGADAAVGLVFDALRQTSRAIHTYRAQRQIAVLVAGVSS